MANSTISSQLIDRSSHLTFISQSTPSAATELTITSGFSDTYVAYQLICYSVETSVDTDIRLEVSDDGGSTWYTTAAGYTFRRYENDSTHSSNAGTSATYMSITPDIDSTGVQSGITWMVFDSNSQRALFHSNWVGSSNTGTYGLFSTIGVTNQTNIDAIRIYPASGNMTGTFDLYGLPAS